MMFRLHERSSEWIDRAPIHLVTELELGASPAVVFATLVNHEGWPTWFRRMRRVRIDGSASGIGALRTVWVGAASVQEHFVRWDADRRLTFNIVRSKLPGMHSMTEDWELIDGSDNHCTLRITIGVEPSPLLRPISSLIRVAVAHSTRGASGIANMFERGK